jgi:hypothetical protein
MSNLTVGLAILGGLVLAAMVAHSAWSARRNTPRQPLQPEAPRNTDDLDARQEPGMDFEPMPLAVLEKKPGLDALIDVIAPIALDGPVSGDAALAAHAAHPPRRQQAVCRGRPERTHPAVGNARAGPALQRLPGRGAARQPRGRAQRNRVLGICHEGPGLCRRVGGAPEFPEMLDEVARARELDQFASGHDAQLGFTLRARSAAWSPGYVQQHAQKLGFVAGAIPGRMVLPASVAGMPPVLGLAFDTQAALADDPAQSAIREVTLSLDVPQVQRSEQPFVRMREAAITLAASMDGIITDDNGQVIRAEALDVIGADLEQLYDTLDARDLSAGSVLADGACSHEPC